MTAEEQESALCVDCDHDFDSHFVVPTKKQMNLGGIIICQVKGCKCITSWDFPPYSSQEDVYIPTETELALLREKLQTEEA